jgi:hypothetical protein
VGESTKNRANGRKGHAALNPLSRLVRKNLLWTIGLPEYNSKARIQSTSHNYISPRFCCLSPFSATTEFCRHGNNRYSASPYAASYFFFFSMSFLLTTIYIDSFRSPPWRIIHSPVSLSLFVLVIRKRIFYSSGKTRDQLQTLHCLRLFFYAIEEKSRQRYKKGSHRVLFFYPFLVKTYPSPTTNYKEHTTMKVGATLLR